MIQTSFFPQPEKDKPIKIIQISPSGLQPRKVEEVIPDDNIAPDTYMIYPTGGYHPFYKAPNTFPRYQLPIWPRVVRIKFSKKFKSQEKMDRARASGLREHQTIEQLNPYLQGNYFHLMLNKNTYSTRFQHTRLKKNGKPERGRAPDTKKAQMHRLVALAFIPNPENDPFVLHDNDDSTNYLIENLIWGTPGQNLKGCMRRRPDTMEQKYLDLVNKEIIKG